MKRLNIVFCLRRNFRQFPAGDIVQMMQWQKALQLLNHHVTLCDGDISDADMAAADMAVIWHLDRLHESFPFWEKAQKFNKPIWLVPTCWSDDPRLSPFKSLKEELKLFLRRIFKKDSFSCGRFVKHWQKNRQKMLLQSSLLLVNSEAEKTFLLKQGAAAGKVVVLPNVIDTAELARYTSLPWEERKGIIHVGHFCPRKNQLRLIRQLRRSNIPVTFIGTARPMHKLYFRLCLLLGKKHYFPGALPREEVLKLMGQSRLCLSTSLSETPGLSNLEAACMGCALILPDIEPVKEYFGSRARYVRMPALNPQLLQECQQFPPDAALKHHIQTHYNENTPLEIFEKLLNQASVLKDQNLSGQ